MPRCPKCNTDMENIRVTDVPLKGPGDEVRYGLIYECPSCAAFLGVQIDSVQLVSDIIRGIRER